jgi:hypothetical protein
VVNISDQLPIPIKALNFADLLKFTRQGLKLEEESQTLGLQMISTIVKNVEINYRVEFFIPDLCIQFKSFWGEECRNEELTRYACRLIHGLTLLNPTHPRQLWQAGTLHDLVMLLLESDTYDRKLKPTTVAAIMDALTSISHDPLIRGHISKRLTPLVLASKIDYDDELCCLQSASELFSKLFLQAKFQSSLPLTATNVNAILSRTSKKLTNNENNDHLLSVFTGDSLTGEQGESNYCCGFLIPALSVCLDVLVSHLNRSEEEDQANIASDNPNNEYKEDPVVIVSKVIQMLSRYQSFTAYIALTGILHRGRELIFPLLRDVSSFRLDRVILVDVFLAFGGHQDLCWMHTVLENDQELIDDAKVVPHTYPLDNGIKSFVSSKNGNNNGKGNMNQSTKVRPPSSISSATPENLLSTEWLLFELGKKQSKDSTPNELIKIMGIKLLLHHKTAFQSFLADWELKPTATICQTVIVFFVIAKTVGIGILDTVINLGDFVDMLLELLRDERLGLNRYPGMEEKCVQVLVCMGYEAAQILEERQERGSFSSGFNFISYAVSVCDYALKNLVQHENIQDPNLMYVYLSALIAVSSHDRLCRRKIVSSFSKITDVFSILDQSSSLAPLLRLVLHVIDSIGKVDRDGEEGLLSLVVRGLRMLFAGGYDLGVLSCSVIAEAGSIHQNLAYRLFMRREVEDILAMLIHQGGVKSRLLVEDSFSSSIEDLDFEDLSAPSMSLTLTLEEQCMRASLSRNRYTAAKNLVRRETENPQTMLLLRACSVCMKDMNPKPFWMFTSWSYGWWVYNQGLSRRPLIRQQAVEALANMCRTAESSIKVLVLAQCLDYASSLMYNCIDGANGIPGRPSPLSGDPEFQQSVKDSLYTYILPILPNALAIIGNEENHKFGQVQFARWLTITDSTAVTFWTDPTHFISDKANEAYRQISKSIRMPMSTLQSKLGRSSNVGLESTVVRGTPPRYQVVNSYKKQKQDADVNLLMQFHMLQQNSRSDDDDEPHINRAMELLTEKTVESIFAFLCTNDKLPMSTYLVNKRLFDKHPVATSIVYAMRCYPDNSNVQRRGIEIMRCFIQADVDISTFCYYAPSILIVALNLHDDTSDVHSAFAVIVNRLAKVDEVTRSNMVNYSVHRGLAAIIRRKVADTSYLCLIALQSLAMTIDMANQITGENSNVLSAVIYALDMFPQDIRILMEGMRCLLCFKQTAEYKRIMETRGGEGTFKKTRKALMKYARIDKNTGSYSTEDVEYIISVTYQFSFAQCITS